MGYVLRYRSDFRKGADHGFTIDFRPVVADPCAMHGQGLAYKKGNFFRFLAVRLDPRPQQSQALHLGCAQPARHRPEARRQEPPFSTDKVLSAACRLSGT